MGFAALVMFERRADRVIARARRWTNRKWIPRRLQRIFLSVLERLAAALAILKDWREIFWVGFWTLMLWLAIAVPTWMVLLAFDLPISFSDSLFIMGLASMSSIIPTPGGAAGAFHTATAASLLFLRPDVRREDAAALSIAMHLIYFAPAVIFGLYYFFHGDISVERFRSLLSSENAEREIESDSPDFVPES